MKKKPSVAYALTDGTVVMIFKIKKNGLTVGEYAEVHGKFFEGIHWVKYEIPEGREFASAVPNLPQLGRIVFHESGIDTLLKLVKGSRVDIALNNASINSTARGITVTTMEIRQKDNSEFRFDMVEFLSSPFTVQHDVRYNDTFDRVRELTHWGFDDAPVTKVTGAA